MCPSFTYCIHLHNYTAVIVLYTMYSYLLSVSRVSGMMYHFMITAWLDNRKMDHIAGSKTPLQMCAWSKSLGRYRRKKYVLNSSRERFTLGVDFQ